MALVQAPPVTTEPHQQNPPTLEVPGHAPPYRDLHGGVRRRAPSAESPQDAPVQSLAAATSSRGQQSRKYIFTNEEYVDEWSDAVFCPGSDADELREVGGPPPQLVPVSGRLEKVSADWTLQCSQKKEEENFLLLLLLLILMKKFRSGHS